MIEWQYDWLESELKKANTAEERARHPWIMTIAHHPMYCTTADGDDCNHYDSVVRTTLPTCVSQSAIHNSTYSHSTGPGMIEPKQMILDWKFK